MKRKGILVKMKNMLDKIGFTQKQQNLYYEYEKSAGERAKQCAKEYMCNNMEQKDALEMLHSGLPAGINEYTADLMFLLESVPYLKEKYAENGVSEEVFLDTVRDIKYKLDECEKVKNIFGTFVASWFDGFFKMTRFALGRLQYDVSEFEKDEEYCGCMFKKGDLRLSCHIPSSGPLKPEFCEESLKTAYEFFKNRLSGGVMPVFCSSWLLYPPYIDVFGENSNTAAFIGNFKIISTTETDDFGDAWRIFSKDFDGNADNLPAETSMQKSFINYIKNGGKFGGGLGILIFDGKTVLTRK